MGCGVSKRVTRSKENIGAVNGCPSNGWSLSVMYLSVQNLPRIDLSTCTVKLRHWRFLYMLRPLARVQSHFIDAAATSLHLKTKSVRVQLRASFTFAFCPCKNHGVCNKYTWLYHPC